MQLPLFPVVDLPNGSVTIPIRGDALFRKKKSVLENHLTILSLLTVLTGKIGMVFPLKCRLTLSLASS